jgi:hypothetical protein
LVTLENGQQPAGDRETDAFGLGGGSELGLPVGIDNHGLAQIRLELGANAVEGVEVLLPLGEGLLLEGRVEVAKDGGGFAV